MAKDLAESLKSLDGVCSYLSLFQINGHGLKLKQLVCNAGIGVGPYNETKDGLDSHMQVNFISQFHFTLILLPLLQRTANSRLVLQSSDLHHAITSNDVRFERLSELTGDIGPMKLYARTKLAQILFIRALSRRAENGEMEFGSNKELSFGTRLQAEKGGAKGPWMNATHPGAVNTDQPEQAVDAYGTIGKIGVKAVRPFMKGPVEEGCRPALFAVASNDVVKEKIQGQYVSSDVL